MIRKQLQNHTNAYMNVAGRIMPPPPNVHILIFKNLWLRYRTWQGGVKTASIGLRDKEISLECPGGANVLTRVLKTKEGGRRLRTGMMAAKKDQLLLALKTERSHDLGNAGNLQNLKEARKWILPYSLQKGPQPQWHHDFSPVRPILHCWSPEWLR